MAKIISRHGFGLGHAYETAQPSSPQEYLDIALRTEKFVTKYAHKMEDGIYWKKSGPGWRGDPADIDLSLYSGSAGVLYFYLKLQEATGDSIYLETIREGTRYIAAHWRDFFDQTPVFGDMDLRGSEYGMYFGVGSLALVLGEVYRNTGDETAKKGALEIYEFYKEKMQEDADGYYWTGSTGAAMDGGVLMVLLQQYELFGDPETLEIIKSAGRHYAKQGVRIENGGLEYNGVKGITDPISWPNFEFGTSGAGYLMTLLYELTGDEEYLKNAEDCTLYMKTIIIPQKKGYLTPHDVGAPVDAPKVCFLGSCHGPGGNAKLFYRLHKLTGKQEYLDEINAGLDGMESVGAPERQSPGLWNTLCYCCGHAGLVHYFLGLYHAYGEARYLDLARRAAYVILGEREDHEDGTTTWPMAFWRIQPDFLTEDLGYYDGQAGMAISMLEMYLTETGTFHWKRLPDDPFPEEAGK